MTLKLEWRKWDGLANEKQQPRGLPFWAIFGPLRSTDKLQGERREESWNKSDQGFNLWTIYLGPVVMR
jgi:hypothetical protein